MEQIDLRTSEDITQFTDEEQVAVDKINHEFVQENPLKGETREFTLFNDIQCYQAVRRKHGGKYKYRVNLSHLDPKPKREFILADNWLIIAAISGVIGFMLVYIGWFSDMQFDSQIMVILSALSICFCLIAFLIALLKTRDRVLLYSYYGRAPVLELMNKNPDRASFAEFMALLSEHISQARENSTINSTDRLVAELKELRRLKDETVISEAVYEQAKKRIFRNPAFSQASA